MESIASFKNNPCIISSEYYIFHQAWGEAEKNCGGGYSCSCIDVCRWRTGPEPGRWRIAEEANEAIIYFLLSKKRDGFACMYESYISLLYILRSYAYIRSFGYDLRCFCGFLNDLRSRDIVWPQSCIDGVFGLLKN